MNFKSNIAMNLLTTLGLIRTASLPQAPGLPDFLGVHTNPKRNKQRGVCRALGPRQYRRLKCLSYTLKRNASHT